MDFCLQLSVEAKGDFYADGLESFALEASGRVWHQLKFRS